MAQRDSCRCDSLRIICDSLVKAQDVEIGQLRRALDRRDNELLLQERIAVMSDTIHTQFFRDLDFELAEQRRMSGMNTKYFVAATVMILGLSILFGHIR